MNLIPLNPDETKIGGSYTQKMKGMSPEREKSR